MATLFRGGSTAARRRGVLGVLRREEEERQEGEGAAADAAAEAEAAADRFYATLQECGQVVFDPEGNANRAAGLYLQEHQQQPEDEEEDDAAQQQYGGGGGGDRDHHHHRNRQRQEQRRIRRELLEGVLDRLKPYAKCSGSFPLKSRVAESEVGRASTMTVFCKLLLKNPDLTLPSVTQSLRETLLVGGGTAVGSGGGVIAGASAAAPPLAVDSPLSRPLLHHLMDMRSDNFAPLFIDNGGSTALDLWAHIEMAYRRNARENLDDGGGGSGGAANGNRNGKRRRVDAGGSAVRGGGGLGVAAAVRNGTGRGSRSAPSGPQCPWNVILTYVIARLAYDCMPTPASTSSSPSPGSGSPSRARAMHGTELLSNVDEFNALVQELTRHYPFMGFPHYRQPGLAMFYFDLALEQLSSPSGPAGAATERGISRLDGLTLEFAVNEILKNNCKALRVFKEMAGYPSLDVVVTFVADKIAAAAAARWWSGAADPAFTRAREALMHHFRYRFGAYLDALPPLPAPPAPQVGTKRRRGGGEGLRGGGQGGDDDDDDDDVVWGKVPLVVQLRRRPAYPLLSQVGYFCDCNVNVKHQNSPLTQACMLAEKMASSPGLRRTEKVEAYHIIFRHLLSAGLAFTSSINHHDDVLVEGRYHNSNVKVRDELRFSLLYALVPYLSMFGMNALAQSYADVHREVQVLERQGHASPEESRYVMKGCQQTLLRLLWAKLGHMNLNRQVLERFRRYFPDQAAPFFSTNRQAEAWARGFLREMNPLPGTMRHPVFQNRPDLDGLLHRAYDEEVLQQQQREQQLLELQQMEQQQQDVAEVVDADVVNVEEEEEEAAVAADAALDERKVAEPADSRDVSEMSGGELEDDDHDQHRRRHPEDSKMEVEEEEEEEEPSEHGSPVRKQQVAEEEEKEPSEHGSPVRKQQAAEAGVRAGNAQEPLILGSSSEEEEEDDDEEQQSAEDEDHRSTDDEEGGRGDSHDEEESSGEDRHEEHESVGSSSSSEGEVVRLDDETSEEEESDASEEERRVHREEAMHLEHEEEEEEEEEDVESIDRAQAEPGLEDVEMVDNASDHEDTESEEEEEEEEAAVGGAEENEQEAVSAAEPVEDVSSDKATTSRDAGAEEPSHQQTEEEAGYDAEESQGHTEEEDERERPGEIIGARPTSRSDIVQPPPSDQLVQVAVASPKSRPVEPPVQTATSQLDAGYEAEDSQGHTDEEERKLESKRAPEAPVEAGYEAEDSQGHTEGEEEEVEMQTEDEEEQNRIQVQIKEATPPAPQPPSPPPQRRPSSQPQEDVPQRKRAADSSQHTLSDMSAADERTEIDQGAESSELEVEETDVVMDRDAPLAGQKTHFPALELSGNTAGQAQPSLLSKFATAAQEQYGKQGKQKPPHSLRRGERKNTAPSSEQVMSVSGDTNMALAGECYSQSASIESVAAEDEEMPVEDATEAAVVVDHVPNELEGKVADVEKDEKESLSDKKPAAKKPAPPAASLGSSSAAAESKPAAGDDIPATSVKVQDTAEETPNGLAAARTEENPPSFQRAPQTPTSAQRAAPEGATREATSEAQASMAAKSSEGEEGTPSDPISPGSRINANIEVGLSSPGGISSIGAPSPAPKEASASKASPRLSPVPEAEEEPSQSQEPREPSIEREQDNSEESHSDDDDDDEEDEDEEVAPDDMPFRLKPLGYRGNKRKDGTYKRPYDKAPPGYYWAKTIGMWEKKGSVGGGGEGGHEEEGSVALATMGVRSRQRSQSGGGSIASHTRSHDTPSSRRTRSSARKAQQSEEESDGADVSVASSRRITRSGRKRKGRESDGEESSIGSRSTRGAKARRQAVRSAEEAQGLPPRPPARET